MNIFRKQNGDLLIKFAYDEKYMLAQEITYIPHFPEYENLADHSIIGARNDGIDRATVDDNNNVLLECHDGETIYYQVYYIVRTSASFIRCYYYFGVRRDDFVILDEYQVINRLKKERKKMKCPACNSDGVIV